jgi:hypothetical protein
MPVPGMGSHVCQGSGVVPKRLRVGEEELRGGEGQFGATRIGCGFHPTRA